MIDVLLTPPGLYVTLGGAAVLALLVLANLPYIMLAIAKLLLACQYAVIAGFALYVAYGEIQAGVSPTVGLTIWAVGWVITYALTPASRQ